VCDLYFATFHNPGMYLHHRFLSLTHAVESYHRRFVGGTELPEPQHRGRTEAILEATPDEYRDWLEENLKYSNELSFRRRLKDLVAKHLPGAAEATPFGDFFIERVVTTRNYYTHYDETLKDKCARGQELYWLTRKLEVILQASLLSEMGFEQETISRFLSRNPKVQYVRMQSSQT